TMIAGDPMSSSSEGISVVVEGRANEGGHGKGAGSIWSGPGLFDALQIPIVYGRAIDERDRANTPRVAVISESMARHYFGVANAVGRRFRIGSEADLWIEVIGVVRDTGTGSLMGDLVDPTI